MVRSFPRKRESRGMMHFNFFWVPAFAGTNGESGPK
jgi:hypothetical protein